MNTSPDDLVVTSLIVFLVLFDITIIVVMFSESHADSARDDYKNCMSKIMYDLSFTGSKRTSIIYWGMRPGKKALHNLAWELYKKDNWESILFTDIKVKNVSLLQYRLEERLGPMSSYRDMYEEKHPHKIRSY